MLQYKQGQLQFMYLLYMIPHICNTQMVIGINWHQWKLDQDFHWVCIGDFNQVLTPVDKLSSSSSLLALSFLRASYISMA